MGELTYGTLLACEWREGKKRLKTTVLGFFFRLKRQKNVKDTYISRSHEKLTPSKILTRARAFFPLTLFFQTSLHVM